KRGESRAKWDEALVLRDRIDDPYKRAENRIGLADALAQGGKPNEARTVYQDTIRYLETHAREEARAILTARVLSELAELELDAGDCKASAAFSSQYITIVEHSGAKGSFGSDLKALGHL